MKRLSTIAGLITTGIILSACSNAGTTYGTGTSHELATVKGLSSIFDLKQAEQEKIDYSPRPDLVMPANKNNLPTPVEQANTSVENWPVSPAERQEAIQNAAPEVDNRTRNPGGLDPTFALSEKQGIGVQKVKRRRFDPAIDSSRATGATAILRDIQLGKNKRNSSEAVARQQQLTYTSGSAPRRFLTEPPAEYRTPAATAEAGDLGIDEAELTERQLREAQINKDAENGIITPGVN